MLKNLLLLKQTIVFSKIVNVLKFVRPTPNSVLKCEDHRGIKLITRLRVGLSHLCEHKLKHSFQDTLNPICSCGFVDKSTTHYVLHCLMHSDG